MEVNWNNKDKRISFLSIFRTIVGEQGIKGTDIAQEVIGGHGASDKYFRIAVKLTDRLFATYPTEPDIFEEKKKAKEVTDFGDETFDISTQDLEELNSLDDDFGTPEQREIKQELRYEKVEPIKKARTPFKGKDGKMMYPTACGNCNALAWSPKQGEKTKSCKACR